MATIVQRPNGTWRVQVRRTGAPSLSRNFQSHGEARRFATQVEHSLDKGRLVRLPGAVTFADLLAGYRTLSGRPARSRDAALTLIGRELGPTRLDRLDAAVVVRFAKARRRGGAGPATVLQDLSYIGTVLVHAAVPLGVDTAGAVEAVRAARATLAHAGQIAKPIERDRRPTQAEIDALCSHWRKNPRQTIPMVDIASFAIATAMRLSEITSLRWDDLDPGRRAVTIRDRKHPRQKRGNTQVVPLLEVTGYDAHSIALRQPRTLGAGPSPLVFPYRAASVSTAFTRAVKALKLGDLHFHDLRHEGCSRMFEAGLSIEQVALVSGHRDWNMLRRYTKLGPEHVHAAAARARHPTLRVVGQ